VADDLPDTYLELAREHVVIPLNELWTLLAARHGLDVADPETERQIDRVEQELMEDPGRPVTMLHPDVVVHIPAITDGIVLTHRLSATESAEGYLLVDTDLAGFLRCPDPRVASGPLELDDYGPAVWDGPEGWLDEYKAGALLAVRVQDGEVTISALDAEPAEAPELVATLRAAYDREVEEPGLPLSAEDLVVATLHRDRSAFAEPRPPLTELAAAAGLEQRGVEFAHDDEVWENAAAADRFYRLRRELGPDVARTVFEVLDLLTERRDDRSALRDVLGKFGDPAVLEAVTDELLSMDDDPDEVAEVAELADRLLDVAGARPDAAAAGWMAAIAAERGGRVLDAESHLRAAVAVSGGWPLVVDRLAWYEFDRGDAAAALAHWESIGAPEEAGELVVARIQVALGGPTPGRNQPCWCGSGRKFKQCHQGKPPLASLPERAPWLYRKAVAYLERRGGSVDAAWGECASAYAGADGDIAQAMGSSIVIDVLLHEYDLFRQFLTERGPLLPDDERGLAESWTRANRDVYEVLEVGEDRFTARQLRTGASVEIIEGMPHRLAAPGAVLLVRPLPDGENLRVGAATVTLPDDAVEDALELLDGEPGPELLVWLGATVPPR
jgi:hypothetical protein